MICVIVKHIEWTKPVNKGVKYIIPDEKGLIDYRKKIDWPVVSAKVQAHKQEMGREGEWLRISALAEQMDDLQAELDSRWLRWMWAKQDGKNAATLALIASKIPGIESDIERKRRELIYLLERGLATEKARDEITDDMISRAKDYPIENMVESRRGLARCISGSHEDRHPSMSIKNNRCHCFSCGYDADSIDVAAKLYGLSFQDAVRRLQ